MTASAQQKGESPTNQRLIKRISDLYIQGAKSMRLGKTLWKIIAIKLFVIFVIFKLFFFPDLLEIHFSNDSQRADHVIEVLTRVPGSAPLSNYKKFHDRR